jgi:hypothetical protein
VGAFDRFSFHETVPGGEAFLPPRVKERKLCASTHVIQTYDAPQLQRWLGKTLEITVYGTETSQIYCAVLTGNLYTEVS